MRFRVICNGCHDCSGDRLKAIRSAAMPTCASAQALLPRRGLECTREEFSKLRDSHAGRTAEHTLAPQGPFREFLVALPLAPQEYVLLQKKIWSEAASHRVVKKHCALSRCLFGEEADCLSLPKKQALELKAWLLPRAQGAQ